MGGSNDIYDSMIQHRGAAYRDDQVASYSHYHQPIDHTPGRLAGQSHVWGDASAQVQSRVIDTLIAASERAGLNTRQTAEVLAIARVESGFNPDAAAGPTSAYGLGQFVDRTAAAYGLDGANRTNVEHQAQALVALYQDNAALAQARGQGDEYIYKYHHDGPTGEYGGLGISHREVMPYVDGYEAFVRQHQQTHGVTPVDPALARPQHGHADPQAVPHGHETMSEGSRGPQVEQLQKHLLELGYGGQPPLAMRADGDFGPRTRQAVEAFQRAHGMAEDGVAGPATLRAIQQEEHGRARESAQIHMPRSPSTPPSGPRLDESGHPGHAMFKQAQHGVHQIDLAHQRKPDYQSDNIAAALTVQARRDGLAQIDHVHLSPDASHTYAIQGALNSPFKQLSHVRTVEAARTPIEHSSAQWHQAQQQAQQGAPQAAPQPQRGTA
ncbi:XVIPCD domain-containing protein [Dyella sp.]|uniref:XVIPCD domain-containing protein n=1 Tax=Dyella sp. TaxID=1869338 RepID=UPI002ED181E4